MTRLYSTLAHVYHEMYQSIFDYQREFRSCQAIFKRHGCRSVLEIACGSGNLASRFLAAGYGYLGLDRSRQMLTIARRETPAARFVQGDMRRFRLARRVDAVYVGGRSFSYLTANRDVQDALRCMHLALRPGGVLLFDTFDAGAIFKNLGKRMTQTIRRNGKTFTRHSTRSLNLKTGWTWNWVAHYTIEEGEKRRDVHDVTVLRSFTPDELRLFLALAGFTPLRIGKNGGIISVVAEKARAAVG